MNILSVAEKPSVARELTRIISGVPYEGLKRQGYSPYNPVFDIESCQFQNRNAKMKMTSVSGHLMGIEFDPAFKSWNNCQPIELFTAPLKKDVKDEFAQIKRTLVQEARSCNVLLLWLDCDLEGENIAFEVIQVCCQANPRLDVYRARFSALIDRDIKRTMQFPERPNSLMNDAVDARQEIDLRIGAAFTRFQTMRLQKRFKNVGASVISYGPCQFPTLGFVVDRDLRIKAFRPENFWYLSCDIEYTNPDKDDGSKLTCTFHWDRTRVYDKLSCLIMYETCIEDGQAIVTHCSERPTTKHKPIPLNTVELQKRASRLLKIGSERTMAVAEALYQRGILSYPRTETDFFKEGFEILPLLQDHRAHSQWGAFTTQLLDANGYEQPRAGQKDDQAHPPIHPTKCVELNTLDNEDERKIYDLVTRHFLACCSRDARGSQTKMSISIPSQPLPHGNVGESFSATGLMIIEKNFLEVYGKYDYWSGSKVPKLTLHQIITPKRLLMSEGRTTPPEPLNESDLISAMDTNGIGTDATIAAHIATIQAREYVVKDAQNRFVATKLGLALVEGYNSMGYQLNKPQLRAAIEADCKKVALGQMPKEEAVRKCLDTMRECFLTCNREATKLDESMGKYFPMIGNNLGIDEDGVEYQTITPSLSTCGVCKNAMNLRVEGTVNARGVVKPKDGAQRFLFCTTCVKSFLVPAKGELTAHAVSCVLCGFQVLNVKNVDTSKQHTICPFCYSNPPAPLVGVEASDDFRCFQCAKAECELSGRVAGSDVNITPCSDPRCEGQMRIKKGGKGTGLVIGCTIMTCNTKWWLPKFVRSALPVDFCQRCHQSNGGLPVRKLQFSFIMSKAPPFVDPECTLCPVCDPLWNRLDITPLSIRRGGAPPAPPTPSRTNTVSTSATAAVTSPNRFVQRASAQSKQRSTNSGAESNNPVAEYPPCLCGMSSIQLVTTKEGPNQGRPFFTCKKPRETKCDYFLWCDVVTSASNASSSAQSFGAAAPAPSNSLHRSTSYTNKYSNNNNSNHSSNNNRSIGGSPNCKCEVPATLLTVNKEGPNKGRKFYRCSKSDVEKCNFFQWDDE